jgi:hypothetical protein
MRVPALGPPAALASVAAACAALLSHCLGAAPSLLGMVKRVDACRPMPTPDQHWGLAVPNLDVHELPQQLLDQLHRSSLPSAAKRTAHGQVHENACLPESMSREHPCHDACAAAARSCTPGSGWGCRST